MKLIKTSLKASFISYETGENCFATKIEIDKFKHDLAN